MPGLSRAELIKKGLGKMSTSTLSKKALSVWAVAISFAIALFACGFAPSANAANGKQFEPATPGINMAASALDYNSEFALPTKVYRVSTKYSFYGKCGAIADSNSYFLNLKNAKVKGSVTVTGGKDLEIKVDKTCYINGGIYAHNITIYGAGTLYVKGGIHATGEVVVARNFTSTGKISTKSFTLKAYNTANKATCDGIYADSVFVTNNAKVYASGYKYSPYGVGIGCNDLTVTKGSYVKGSGKRYGIVVLEALQNSGSISASQTSSTPLANELTSQRYIALSAGVYFSYGGTVTATASGKYSNAMSVNGTCYVYGTLKAYAKNYGNGLVLTGGDLEANDGKITAYGGHVAIGAYNENGISFTNSTVYAYGRKSTSTLSKYRTGDGIYSANNMTVDHSKVYVVAKSSTEHVGAAVYGTLSILNGSTVSATAKTGYGLAAYDGIEAQAGCIIKLNGKSIPTPVSTYRI